MEQNSAIEVTRFFFNQFVEGKAAAYSPTYAALAAHTAGDDDLIGIAAKAAPWGRIAPDLFLAAVQYLVRSEGYVPLLPLFDEGLDAPGTDALVALFGDFCRTRAAELGEQVGSTRLQTNEPGRCAALLIGLLEVEQLCKGPIHLVDLGASAGLLLVLDLLEYSFEADDGRRSVVRPRTEPRGVPVPPLPVKLWNWREREMPTSLPDIGQKVGIDLTPLDVTRPEDRLMLESYVWPEERDRRVFIRSVAELASQRPPEIRSGDAADVLPEVLASLPEDGVVCVINSHAVGQFPAETVRAVDAVLAPQIADGRCVKLALEGRPGGPLTAPQHGPTGGSYAQLRLTSASGTASLLLAGSHGGWIEGL
ncbi:DUF2332 domain-containing protein [Streptacidiphilus sp. P02-A3a]|uniref:DUF2332 domain-containing protein n=1 Tax=Streptacidiphilus sp. P02-A3a TaxID=2704468 RepID=UPI0015FE3B61|nr:DUF2332 domain-containing protein [Streptacidiphilus sp. P02-A3a]QMU67196.1 DUF2332 domain-containing protein [Streptacidiphilus sp. P02-A3a]